MNLTKSMVKNITYFMGHRTSDSESSCETRTSCTQHSREMPGGTSLTQDHNEARAVFGIFLMLFLPFVQCGLHYLALGCLP